MPSLQAQAIANAQLLGSLLACDWGAAALLVHNASADNDDAAEGLDEALEDGSGTFHLEAIEALAAVASLGGTAVRTLLETLVGGGTIDRAVELANAFPGDMRISVRLFAGRGFFALLCVVLSFLPASPHARAHRLQTCAAICRRVTSASGCPSH